MASCRKTLIIMVFAVLALGASAPAGEYFTTIVHKHFYPKYDSYVDLVNFLYGDLEKAARHYLNSCGGPEYSPEMIARGYQPYAFPANAEAVFRAAKANVGQEPKLPGDAQIAALLPVMAKIWALLCESDAYHRTGQYVADNFARGRKMHGELREELAKCPPLADAFFREMQVIIDLTVAADVRRMQDLEYGITLSMLAMLNACEEANGWLAERGIGDAGIGGLDVEGFQPLCQAMQTALADLEGMVKKKDPVREGLTAAMVGEFTRKAVTITACAANLLAVARKAKAEDNPPPAESGKNQLPSEFDKQVNELIVFFNSNK